MSEFDRVPPHNFGAEQAVLGALILDPSLIGAVLEECPPGMFYVPKHTDIATVLADMAGKPVDPQLLLSELTSRGLADRVGGAVYLVTLLERGGVGAARYHAADVREAFRRRRLIEAATRAIQRTYHPDAELGVACLELEEALEEVTTLGVPARQEPAPLIADLLATEDTHDWLVPGLLERMDRLVLTGAEGAGKSFLLAQFAACMAAGAHPFTGAPIEALRVLVVDCENSRRQIRRRYRSIIDLVRYARGDTGGDKRLHILTRPEGMDLLGVDAAWLEGYLGATKPDVLIVGPLYRLHTQSPNDEQAARALVDAVDKLRIRHGVALLIEAHAGHAEDGNRDRKMRPSGSSLFLRWPEFGYGLRRAKADPGGHRPVLVDVVAWRGAREDRDWPQQLEWGGPGKLPWVSAKDQDIYSRVRQMHADPDHREGA